MEAKEGGGIRADSVMTRWRVVRMTILEMVLFDRGIALKSSRDDEEKREPNRARNDDKTIAYAIRTLGSIPTQILSRAGVVVCGRKRAGGRDRVGVRESG